jgi:SNF2 family DNA or RNA helicase
MYKKLKKVNKTLVLVPNVVMVGNWGVEVETFTDLSWIDLVGTKKERLEKLEKEADIYIMNYHGLQSLLAYKRTEKTKKGKSLISDPFAAVDFAKRFDAIIYDECHSSGLKNHRTLTFALCAMLSKRIPFRYGLTGTPMGRDPMDLWSQFYLIDQGETLGKTLTIFRESFFKVKINHWGGWDYKLKPKMENALYEKLKNKSIRYTEEEANELPDKVYIKKIITLSKEADEYYKRAKEGLIEALRDNASYISLQNAFVRYRMLTSGFMRYKETDDEGNTLSKMDIVFKENPKLDMLEELLLDTPPSSKVVVFYEYIKSGELISQRLKKLKIKHSTLGGQTKNKEKARDTFLKDEKCKIFVVNSKSGGVGLNLQVANYCIFYESPVSPIIRKQAEKRCHRTGSKKTVFFYDIVAQGTVDEKILAYLKEGKDLFEALVEGRKLKAKDRIDVSEILMPGINKALKKGIKYE